MTSTKHRQQFFPSILRNSIPWALLLCAIATHTTAQDIESALPTIRATGNTYALIGALSGVASQHLQAGRDAEAAERIKEAISLCRQTKNASAWNGTLMIATQVITKTEGVEAAEKFLVEILHEESENVDIEILVLKELGRFLEYNGQRVRAIQVMHDHLVLVAKKAPGSSSEADVLLSYGRACTRVGLHDLGVPALKKAKELSKKFANAMMAVQCDDAIADACLETGEFDIAKQILLKQYADAKASNDPTAKYLVEPRVAMGLIRMEMELPTKLPMVSIMVELKHLTTMLNVKHDRPTPTRFVGLRSRPEFSTKRHSRFNSLPSFRATFLNSH